MTLLEEYIKKHGKYIDELIKSTNHKYIDSIDYYIPSIRTILKSSQLNIFFDKTLYNLTYLYAILDNKLQYINAKYKETSDILDKYKERIETITDKFSSTISEYKLTIKPEIYSYDNTLKTDEIKLEPKQSFSISKSNIENITISTLPDIEYIYSYPIDENNNIEILLDDHKKTSSVIRKLTSETPLSYWFDKTNTVHSGVLVNINITCTETMLPNRLYIELGYNNYYIHGITQIDNNENQTYIPIDESIHSFIDHEFDTNLEGKEFIIHIGIPFANISNSESNILYSEIENLIYLIDNFNSPDDVKSKISNISSGDNTMNYTYTISLNHIKLDNIEYKMKGYVESNIINIRNYGRFGFTLSTTQDKENEHDIIYIINIEGNRYVLIPNKINNTTISTYNIRKYDDIIQNSINADYTEENGILTYTITDEMIDISKIKILHFDKFPANIPFITLKSIPTNISYIKKGDTVFNQVTSISELYNTTASYFIENQTIILNKAYTDGYFSIEYESQPEWFKIEAHLYTNNNATTPTISDINIDIIPLRYTNKTDYDIIKLKNIREELK